VLDLPQIQIFMIQEAITNYKSILANLPKAIAVSGYRKDYIAKKLGISPQSFSAKISRKSFSPEDAERLLKVIKNEDVEGFFMLERMKALKNGDNVSYEDAKKELRWK
jgi:ABC-type Zn uptake system ZnuABC Zn-binding protein ZnuA